jgi:hypothetical protein
METMDTSKIIPNLEETEVEEVDEDVEEVDEDVMKANVVETNQEIIFDFAIKTCKKMKELGILSITQSPQEIQLKTKDQLYKLSSQDINNKDEFVSSNVGLLSSPSKRLSGLTGPAIKTAQLLHQLLTHLHKLPTPAPTMNSSKFDKPELYNQVLLRKLEKGVVSSEDDDFLNVNKYLSPSQKMMIDDYKNEVVVVSEVELLNNEDESYFDLQKEDVIKKLSCQIGKIYDQIIKVRIEEEIKRREVFRSYMNILSIQRRIEIFCSLHKSRNKGETIKNQSTNKIIKYCNITAKELKNILRAAKRIENLLKVANNNWSIIDAFPNIKVNFFRSTINVHDYEIWLKIVETGTRISEGEGKSIHLQKKQQEIKSRNDELLKIYNLANINCSEIISNASWEEEDYE